MARRFAIVRRRNQWLRAAHRATAIDSATDGVSLSWADPERGASAGEAPLFGGGLAFDSAGRLFRSDPDDGRIESTLWAAYDPLGPTPPDVRTFELLGGEPRTQIGDFERAEAGGGFVRSPRGLVVDVDDRLFVAESGAGRVLVVDLWSRRLLRAARVAAAGDAGPVDLTARRRTVWALLPSPPRLVRLDARSGPLPPVDVERPGGVPADAVATRVAISPRGVVFVLFRRGREAWVVAHGEEVPTLEIPDGADLEFDGEGVLAVARGPGEDFLRWRRDAEAWVMDVPHEARAYDGLGIARAPDGTIGFWTDRGFRQSIAARLRYARSGRVTTYRLDAGDFQTQWGRVFVDACVPGGTSLTIHCATADEETDEDTIARNPPANTVGLDLRRDDLSPPLVPLSLAPPEGPLLPLHRRETGRELPWSRPEAGDPFETYEAPVIAPPGRYLWVTLELRGNTRSTPRVKAVRAEHPSHDLLRRLPRVFSRDAAAASFLQRYLMLAEGALHELEGRSEIRHALLDPRAAPEELLPWLADFLGLVLDERWPAPTRRVLIEAAPQLWRYRGTLDGLTRFIDLCLDTNAVLIEHYRLRGTGSAHVGASPTTGAVLGSSFRVGGAIGREGDAPLEGTARDAFETHAHRFTVFVPAELTPEEQGILAHLLDVHRPAHTLYEICSVDAGMRVGRGLHLELLSVIGRTGGWQTLQLGGSRLGRASIVGRPEGGGRVGEDTLGETTRVG